MPAGNNYQILDSRDVVADFFPRLEAANEKLWVNDISVLIPVDREVVDYAFVGQAPKVRLWQGGRVEEPLNKYTMTIRNFPYEASFRLSNRDLNNDKTGQLNQRISDLAARTATHWNSLAGTFITAGEAGTQALAYDGQFAFDTDHNESGSNQTNDLTATEVPSANVGTTSTLTTTEASSIITETIAYMMSLTDDKGEPVNQAATNVTILTTKVGHYNGIRTALGLNNLGTGSGNNNPLLAWTDFTINVQYVSNRITAADKLYFFFGTPGMGNAPLIRQVERDVRFSIKDETFDNDSMVYGVDTVRGFGYGMWQKMALVTLS